MLLQTQTERPKRSAQVESLLLGSTPRDQSVTSSKEVGVTNETKTQKDPNTNETPRTAHEVLSGTHELQDMGRCWHWVTDKFWDCLSVDDDDEREDNFVGKLINPKLGEGMYGSGGAVSMDVAALTLAGIIALSKGHQQRLRTDDTIESWLVQDKAPCKGSITGRNVTASCCNNVNFALVHFPKMNHVAVLLEALLQGNGEVYTYHVLDPTFNSFNQDKTKRMKPRVLMEDVNTAGKLLKAISGGLTTREDRRSSELASYDSFRQHFVSMGTFFNNSGDLRYALHGPGRSFRTFRNGTDPTRCFGHGRLLETAARKWRDASWAHAEAP